jgi:hypothetical protein
MRLYVPAIGDRIVLTKEWTFTLYNERRNWAFATSLKIGQENSWTNYGKPIKEVTLPSDTVLEVDRIYIRAFNKSAATDENDYDSITFKLLGGKKQQRFWAKLKDCNNIEFMSPDDGSFKERKAAEEALAKMQPVRLDADTIRTNARAASYGNGPLVSILEPVRLAFDNHIEESKRLHQEAYDAYKRYVEEQEAKYSREPHRHFMSRPRLDSFKSIDPGDLRRRLATLDSPACQFSKRPDGLNVRRFTWPWTDEVARWWYYDVSKYALQGLYVNVVSNESDTEVISAELCEVRRPKDEKKKTAK